MKFKNITYHKGDKWSILSFVGSLNGGHQKKRYFSQDSRWRRPCQDISQIWPRIRCIHEHMRCHLVIQKELCQNLWQLEVSETRVAFVSSTPSSDLSHRRNSMSVYLTSYHHLFMAHSIKGLMHKSPRGLALSQVALYFILISSIRYQEPRSFFFTLPIPHLRFQGLKRKGQFLKGSWFFSPCCSQLSLIS